MRYIHNATSGIRTASQAQIKGAAHMLWRLIKFLLLLVILGAIALVAYAYVGPVLFPSDFAAPAALITEPIILDVN